MSERREELVPRSVREIPQVPEPGVLYVSLDYGTAIHLCACGCGRETVTPLGPDGWTLTFGGMATLAPSIGNFQYPCRSHYFIRDNRVVWS